MASSGAVVEYVNLTDTSDSSDEEEQISYRRFSVAGSGAQTQDGTKRLAQRSMSLQPPYVEPKRTLTSPRVSARPPGDRYLPPAGVFKPTHRFSIPFEDTQRSTLQEVAGNALKPATEARTNVKALTKDVSVKQEVLKFNQEVVRRASLSPEALRVVPKQKRSLVPFTCNDVVEVKSSVQGPVSEDTNIDYVQRSADSHLSITNVDYHQSRAESSNLIYRRKRAEESPDLVYGRKRAEESPDLMYGRKRAE
eukprot:3940834-Rhodomonas_salina.1